jgi:hypothetical protein
VPRDSPANVESLHPVAGDDAMRGPWMSTAILIMGWSMFGSPDRLRAATIKGTTEVLTPKGHHLAMTMRIDDATTTFQLTGPDFSWFAFGFDTNTMAGYSLIVTGLDDQRTIVEQNLVEEGDPGMLQDSQDITVASTVHDQANDLTTITLVRDNDTGDPEDPLFSTNMTSLDVVWGY